MVRLLNPLGGGLGGNPEAGEPGRAGTREREGWRLAHTETPAPAKRSLFWRSSSPNHRSACACVRVTLKPWPQKPRGQSDPSSSSATVRPTSSALGRPASGGLLSRSAPSRNPGCGGRGKTGAPTPTPRLGESIPLPSRDREPGFSSTRAAGRRQGGSRHAATLPPFPGPPAPRRGPGALDSALRQTFPGPRSLEEPAPSTYLRPSGSRAQLGRRAGVCLRGPRSGGRDAGPQPRQPVLSPRKAGRASSAGNSAPAKGEVEVERGARSVPAAAGAAVPRPPPRPPFLPARLPPPPRARDSPRRRGRLVRAGEAQGSPTRRAANGKLEGEMQIPDEEAESSETSCPKPSRQ
nr:translation initiation factor IF-2-like [Pongo pygmaeus]